MPTPSVTASDPDRQMADEIDAILQREATELPPESHLPPPPINLATRQPEQGRYGRLWVVVMLAFALLSIWQTMR